MNQMQNIPIFPLPLTALPSETVPLHIFEEQFKELIQVCRKNKASGRFAEFGVFFSKNGDVKKVGTLVRIDRVLKEYSTGECDLTVTGGKRCRILNRKESNSYTTADIEFFTDESNDWDETLATEAFNLHRTLLKIITGEFPEDSTYVGRTTLSFHLAQSSGLKNSQKQRILEMRDENQRLEQIINHLTKATETIRSAHDVMSSVLCSWELLQNVTKKA